MARFMIILTLFCLIQPIQPSFAQTIQQESSSAALDMVVDINSLNLEPFFGGYYGRVGTVALFVASHLTLPSYDKIYLAMVQVLSQKYGCFMAKKLKRGAYTAFKCRDERVVVFRLKKTPDSVLISSRQFDDQGSEVVVAGRKIVARYPLYKNPWPNFR